MSVASPESLELPIFNGNLPLYNPTDITMSTGNTVLRRCFIEIPPGYANNLMEILRLTDAEHQKLTEFYGIPIVEHTWGLYPKEAVGDDPQAVADAVAYLSCEHNDFYSIPAAPPGWLLAAEVSVIEGTVIDDDLAGLVSSAEINRIEQLLSGYRHEEEDGLIILDAYSRQCMFGAPRKNDNSSADRTIYVDIEPRLKRRGYAPSR